MRKYFWPIILIVKIISSKFKVIKNLLLLFVFFNPGPRGRSLFKRHIETFKKYYQKAKKSQNKINSICELGPGESNYAFIAASKFNIKNFEAVDNKECRFFYQNKIKKELNNISFIKEKEINYELIKNNYRYHSKGLNSLFNLKSNHFDFIYSHFVLQHVAKNEVDEIIRNLSRISKFNAIQIHYIDFRDCFSGGMNNLRFDDKFWESKLVFESGFYTNRISYFQWLDKFKDNGFSILDVKNSKFNKDPIKSKDISNSIYRKNGEILYKYIEVTLRLDQK